MATISTFNPPKNNPPPAPPVLNPAVQPVQTIWDKYFSGNYQEVLSGATQALFAHHAPDYIHIIGLALLGQKRIDDAIPLLRVALVLYPNAPSWFSNSSIAALNAGAHEAALEFAEAGLKHHDDAVLHFAFGNALMHLNRLEEAIQPFVRALQLNDKLHDARLNLGNVLRRLGRSEEALSLYTQVIIQDPKNILALINRAGTLIELNMHDEAAMVLFRLMAIQDSPEVQFMMSMLRLIDGDLKTGFDIYRSRFDCQMAAPDKAMFRKPMLNSLVDAKNAHILVSHEQGFGDSLQFIRYLPDMIKECKQVTLLVPQTLHRLFAPLAGNANIVTDRNQVPDYDYECPMLYMPYLFGTTLETIPGNLPYLQAPQELIVQHKLPHRSPHTHKRVGLVWAGQMRPNPDLAAVDRRRSLSYSHFEPFLDVESLDFVSLQMGDPVAQILEMGTKGKRRPHEVLNNGMDFLDTAAIIMQLDLVITVDTAVAHLAAGLGKPTWILSRFDTCWRWLKDRDDSPWYPGVVRLFRQETRGDWSDCLAEVKTALIKWASE